MIHIVVLPRILMLLCNPDAHSGVWATPPSGRTDRNDAPDIS